MPTDGTDFVEDVQLSLLTVSDLRDDPYNLIADPNFEMASEGYNAWPVPSNNGTDVDPAGTVWTVQNNNAKAGLYSLRASNRAGGPTEMPNANLVECRQGNKYQLKAYVKNAGGTGGTLGSAGLSVHFLESDGETLAGASVEFSFSGVQATYGELRSGLITAPPGTCYLRVYVFTQGQTDGDWYFDQLMLVRALGAEQFGTVATLNGLRDPSFEENALEDFPWYNGTTDAMTAGCTYSTTNPRSGASSLRIATAANNLYLYNRALRAVHPNESLYLYSWIVCTSNAGSSGVLRMGVEWLTSAQALINRTEVDTSAFVGGPPAAYFQLAMSATAPVNAAYARYYLRTTGFTSGAFWYVDDCLMMDSLPAGALAGQTIFPGAVVTDEVTTDSLHADTVEVGNQATFLSSGGGSINMKAPSGFAGSYTITLPAASPTGLLKATAGVIAPAVANTDYATPGYVDAMVAGLLDDRGNYDASSNLFPSSGGSGVAGAVMKGDFWYISVAGTLGGVAVGVGDSIRALIDAPGQTSANWAKLEGNIGYVPENVANRRSSWQVTPDDTHYPTEKLVKDSLDAKQNAFTDSAGLRSALSDETGDGAAVFANNPALTGNPTLTATRPTINITFTGTTAKTRVGSLAANTSHLALNASFNGSVWAQDDTGRASVLFNLNVITPGSEAFNIITIPAGSTTPTVQFSVTATGNVIAGAQSALSTSATDGFLYIPYCAGTPTGTPTTVTGKVPMVFDRTNKKLYVYDTATSTWKSVTLT